MYVYGGAFIYEEFEEEKIVVCTIPANLCPYGNSGQKFNTDREEKLTVCEKQGLVEKAGLIDLESLTFEKHVPKIKFYPQFDSQNSKTPHKITKD